MDQPDFFLPPKANPPAKKPDPVAPQGAFELSIAYQNHIRSARWKNTREMMFKLRGKKCEHCESTSNLEIHHKTYERFGHELPNDLEILCKPHHDEADRLRKILQQRAFEELCASSADSNAKETYLSKVYGDGYRDESMYQEAQEWLDRKREERAWGYEG